MFIGSDDLPEGSLTKECVTVVSGRLNVVKGLKRTNQIVSLEEVDI